MKAMLVNEYGANATFESAEVERSCGIPDPRASGELNNRAPCEDWRMQALNHNTSSGRFLSCDDPPLIIIPLSIMSDASSGGVS